MREAPSEGAGPVELFKALNECQLENERLREALRCSRERVAILESTLHTLIDAMSSVERALDVARAAAETLGWNA